MAQSLLPLREATSLTDSCLASGCMVSFCPFTWYGVCIPWGRISCCYDWATISRPSSRRFVLCHTVPRKWPGGYASMIYVYVMIISKKCQNRKRAVSDTLFNIRCPVLGPSWKWHFFIWHFPYLIRCGIFVYSIRLAELASLPRGLAVARAHASISPQSVGPLSPGFLPLPR